MRNDPSATWILEERSDLIVNWFNGLADAARDAVREAETCIYRGARDDNMPTEISARVEAIRERVRFNCLLASKAAQKHQAKWESHGPVFQNEIARDLADLISLVEQIDALRDFTSGISSNYRSFDTGESAAT